MPPGPYRNPKHEIRSPKQIRISKTQNSKQGPARDSVSVIGTLDLRLVWDCPNDTGQQSCRYSNFEIARAHVIGATEACLRGVDMVPGP
jgi:hypothetical protein